MTVEGGVSEQTITEATNILAELTGSSTTSEVINSQNIAGTDAIVVAARDEGKAINIVVAKDVAVTAASVNNGVFETIVDTSANTTIKSTAADTAVVASAVTTFVQEQLSSATSGSEAKQTAVTNSLASIEKVFANQESYVQVTKIEAPVVETSSSQNVVKLDLSNVDNVVQAIDLSSSTSATATKVVVENAKAVVAVGSATIEIGGTQGTMVAGDDADQILISGLGADTLIGGAGNDSIVGGQNDTFGFNNTGGITTIDGLDSFANFADAGVTFDFAADVFDVTDVASLNSHISQVLGMETWGTANESTTYVFDNGLQVTLTGVTADEVMAEMVAFTI
jgi:hypothetical protein